MPHSIKKQINDLFENGNGADVVKFLVGPEDGAKKVCNKNNEYLPVLMWIFYTHKSYFCFETFFHAAI